MDGVKESVWPVFNLITNESVGWGLSLIIVLKFNVMSLFNRHISPTLHTLDWMFCVYMHDLLPKRFQKTSLFVSNRTVFLMHIKCMKVQWCQNFVNIGLTEEQHITVHNFWGLLLIATFVLFDASGYCSHKHFFCDTNCFSRPYFSCLSATDCMLHVKWIQYTLTWQPEYNVFNGQV